MIRDKDTGQARPYYVSAENINLGDDETYKSLPDVLDEMQDEIDQAGQGGGGYTPPSTGIPASDLAGDIPAEKMSDDVQASLAKADTSLQPSDKTQLQAAITSLQTALNNLIGSGDVQGAIDTFNEVTAFLNGINSSDTLAAKLVLKANAADVYTKLQTYSKGEVDDLVDGIEAGESVVINSDGANIVDEHDNNSVLFAPSARQMKLMYNNIMAMYNALADIAFTNGKPTLDWIGSKTKYTLSYGTLTGCTPDVAAGQVNEGALRIKRLPHKRHMRLLR